MSGGNSHGWPLWRRQIRVLARQEIGRSLLSKRILPILLLAAMPLVTGLGRSLFFLESQRAHPGHTTTEFAQLFHFFMLRFVVFFGAGMVFVKLFRGEILERSLHYHLLAPVRREVLAAEDGLKGLEMAIEHIPNLIITDLMMPGMNGIELMQTMRSRGVRPPVVMITGYGTIDDAVTAIKEGAYDFLSKPVNLKELSHRVEMAIDKQAMAAEMAVTPAPMTSIFLFTASRR